MQEIYWEEEEGAREQKKGQPSDIASVWTHVEDDRERQVVRKEESHTQHGSERGLARTKQSFQAKAVRGIPW